MNTSGRANIEFLVKRMNSALQRRDYPGVLHASASIFETLAKDIVGEPSIQDQSLGSFFGRYAKVSTLPKGILQYMREVFDLRNTTPLAGHGNVQSPEITRETATTLSELTKAIVSVEYALHTGDLAGLNLDRRSQDARPLPSALKASLLHTLEGHTNWVWSLAFSPRGGTLLSSSTDRSIRKWEIMSGQQVGLLIDREHGPAAFKTAFSPDGRILAAGSTFDDTKRTSFLDLWNIASSRILERIEVSRPISNVKFSQSGHLLATFGHDNYVTFWNVVTLEQVHKQKAEGRIALSSDLDFCAIMDQRKEINFVELASGQILKTMRGRTLSVANMVISPDDRFIAVADVAHTIEIWEIASERCVHTLDGHNAEITCMAFNPTGTLLASGSEDGTTRLWDVLRGRELQVLEAPCPVQCLDFHPLGSLLATGTQTHGNRQAVVQLWVLA